MSFENWYTIIIKQLHTNTKCASDIQIFRTNRFLAIDILKIGRRITRINIQEKYKVTPNKTIYKKIALVKHLMKKWCRNYEFRFSAKNQNQQSAEEYWSFCRNKSMVSTNTFQYGSFTSRSFFLHIVSRPIAI